MIAIILGLSCFAAVVNAQVPFLGSCPSVQPMDNFNATLYLGKWYEIQKYFAIFELGGTCVTAEYGAVENASYVSVTNCQINALTRKESCITGTATPTSVASELQVKLASVPFVAPYWVLGTDYTNYSVVWSCNNLGLFNTRIVWILARTREPTDDVLQSAYDVLDNNNVSRTQLTTTDQSNCDS